MASTPSKKSNVRYATTIAVLIILSVVFSTSGGGFASAGLAFLAFCIAIIWIIQRVIDHRVAAQPPKQITVDEFREGRRRLIAGFIIVILLVVILVNTGH